MKILIIAAALIIGWRVTVCKRIYINNECHT